MGVPVRRGLRIDRHAADGIDHPAGGGCGGVMGCSDMAGSDPDFQTRP